MPSIPGFLTNTPLHPSFEKDIRDTHLIYDYDAQDENGNPEKWRYEVFLREPHCVCNPWWCVKPDYEPIMFETLR
jgi:hypothetical protein